MMDKNYLCEIGRISGHSSDDSINLDGKDQSLAIATGYPVAKNLVLTARHALYPQLKAQDAPTLDQLDVSGLFVSWRNSGTASDWQAITGVVYLSNVKLDIALIQCEVPEGAPYVGFSRAEPSAHARWESAGFARAAGRDDNRRRKYWHMDGDILSYASSIEHQFELANPTNKEPPEPAGWLGASGSPVFSNGQLCGVIVSYFSEDLPQILKATPSHAFSDLPAFKQHLEGPLSLAQKQRDTVYQDKISHLLSSSTQANLALHACVCQSKGKAPRIVAEHLLQLELGEAMDACAKARKQLLGRGEVQAAACIKQVLDCVLPVLQDFRLLHTVREKRGSQAHALIRLPVGIKTLAEIIMAGVDERACLHRPRKKRLEYPGGQYELPHAPELGFDAEGKALDEAWKAHVQNKLAFESLNGAFLRYICHALGSPPDDVGTSESHQRRARRELRLRARNDNETYYFIISSGDLGVSPEVLNQTISQFKTDFPEIVFLLLDDAHIDRDEERYYRFREMLPLKSSLS